MPGMRAARREAFCNLLLPPARLLACLLARSPSSSSSFSLSFCLLSSSRAVATRRLCRFRSLSRVCVCSSNSSDYFWSFPCLPLARGVECFCNGLFSGVFFLEWVELEKSM